MEFLVSVHISVVWSVVELSCIHPGALGRLAIYQLTVGL